MKKINSLFALTTLIFVLGVQLNASPIPANAVVQQDNSQMQPPGDSERATVFTGKVMKAKGHYVLMDDRTKVIYALDDQEKAKAYNGKAVKVTGTLETGSDTIHIATIAPAG